jgi:hypothetical protein
MILAKIKKIKKKTDEISRREFIFSGINFFPWKTDVKHIVDSMSPRSFN